MRKRKRESERECKCEYELVRETERERERERERDEPADEWSTFYFICDTDNVGGCKFSSLDVQMFG